MSIDRAAIAASFRDPSGFVFQHNGALRRQVNRSYAPHYDHLIASGLYDDLVRAGLLIPHQEADLSYAWSDAAYKVIQPERVAFISYPYEWSFSQLKDAALAHLRIQERALRFGMTLKDCSAYNIQFHQGRPILIDTLSFEQYQEGEPWVAYRQFCQHFLAPLALMSYKDIRLGQLQRVHIDGVPLDLASALLPWRTRLVLPLLLHVHLHARSQKRHNGKPLVPKQRSGSFSRRAFMGLLDGLRSAVSGLTWQPNGTDWANYYTDLHNYAPEAMEHKQWILATHLDRVQPATVWDLGGNTGVYSRIASDRGIDTVCFDFDPGCVEFNYRTVRDKGESHILPLLLDLTNPSPGIGWGNEERMSLLERGPADMVLALALVHHLAISNNLPFARIAEFLSKIGHTLVIEFVPKSDAQAQKLLASREDIFAQYTESAFLEGFSQYFTILDTTRIQNSNRMVYLMAARQ